VQLSVRKKTSTFIFVLIGLFSILSVMQMAMTRVEAAAIPTPAHGASYTWNILSTSGDVWWWVHANEGHHALEVGGTIKYDVNNTGSNDVGWVLPSGNVWFGNISIYYANASLNWTKTNCSVTESGYALSLSVGNWVGGFIAPANWSQNYNEMSVQSGTSFLYRDASGMIVIDYTQSGQVTHLEYDKSTSVLTYGKTIAYGFSLELQLAGLSSIPVASFTSNKTTIVQGSAVQFTDRSYSGVRPYTYNWSFGDGSSSTSPSPFHVYAAPGNYLVKLTITDAAAQSIMRLGYIIVSESHTEPIPGASPLLTLLSILLPAGIVAFTIAARKKHLSATE
jgi:PKD repeat protein